jgi:hypothetical protein
MTEKKLENIEEQLDGICAKANATLELVALSRNWLFSYQEDCVECKNPYNKRCRGYIHLIK